MQYEIKGAPLPAVEISLGPNETIFCENGGMSWMSEGLRMETVGGGLGKMFSKAFSGESMFQNKYVAGPNGGYIGIASSMPGDILAVEIAPGRDVICQKSSYLASTEGVELSIFFQKKLGAGFFGGEGFIMQKLSGRGMAFVEIDGSTVVKELAAGEKIVIDTGYLAMMDATCTMDIVTVKGLKNMFLGGEGMFNTVVTGPGKVVLQTLPVSQLANSLMGFMPKGN